MYHNKLRRRKKERKLDKGGDEWDLNQDASGRQDITDEQNLQNLITDFKGTGLS